MSQRRVSVQKVAVNRRADGDRRVNRRRETPAAYSAEEAAQIRAMAAETGVEVQCPRCGEPLLFGMLAGDEQVTAREARCYNCRRVVIIGDLR